MNENKYTVEFGEEIEGTYIVYIKINDREFAVNCQTFMTNDYKESYGLSCNNYSGGDIGDSGLNHYLESIGIEEFSEKYDEIVSAIEKCAESHRPENSVLRIIREKENDESYQYEVSLFGAFGPADVHHVRYINKDGNIIVTSEDTSENRAENQLLGYKSFDNKDEYNKWVDEIYENGHYGDCSVSYRAHKDICSDEINY